MPRGIIEFYAGIGGLSAALSRSLPEIRVSLAAEQSPGAVETFRLNFPDTPVAQINLEHVTAETLQSVKADFWWLSPPCQPYTAMGARRELADPRAGSFKRLLRLLHELPPERLALENVVGFRHSSGHSLLIRTLEDLGYQWHEREICPTELGIPMRRPRFYLQASRQGKINEGEKIPRNPRSVIPLRHFLLEEADDNAELRLSPETLSRYGQGLRILNRNDSESYATCFTSGYGRAIMKCGSYLRTPDGGVRRFAPEEILRLLQFPETFRFPRRLSLQTCWKLVGNSLSVGVVSNWLTGSL